MVAHYPPIWQLRWEVGVSGLVHKMSVGVAVVGDPEVGTPFGDIDATRQNGSVTALSTDTTEMLDLLAELYHTSVTIGNVELWKFDDESYESHWIASTTYANTGASVAPTALSKYALYTFRSFGGGVGKILLLEPVMNEDDQVSWADLSGEQQAFAELFFGATSIWKGRDETYFAAFLRASFGQNEKIWRIRNRS